MSAIDLEVTRITPLQQAEIGMRAWKIRAETAEAEVERLHLELERHQVTGDYEMGQHHADAALQAEAERLRKNDELAHVTSAAQNNAILKLSAEVGWLRAALFKIADDSAHADQYVRWAQEALGR